MSRTTQTAIHKTATAMAAVSALVSPVPLADELVLAPTYAFLGYRIARHHGLAGRAIPWRPIAVTAARGLVARGVVNLGAAFLPGVDAVINAATAFTLTEMFGQYVDRACDDPTHASPLELRQMLDSLASATLKTPDRTGAREPRRLRLEMPGLYGDPELAARVTERLQAMPDVLRAEASVRTGRVLVEIEGDLPSARERVARTVEAETYDGAPPAPSWGRLAEKARGAATRSFQVARRVVALRKSRVRMAPPPEEPSVPYYAFAADQVLETFGADPRTGLTSERAEENLHAFGANLLPGMAPRGRSEILAAQLFTTPNALLASAMGLSVVGSDWLEAGAIGVVMTANLAVGYLTERRAEELLLAWGNLRVDRATVVRNGSEMTIAAERVVPGDILIVRAGQPIPADARIIEAYDFTVDESTLTGESEPVEKSVEPALPDTPLAERSSTVHTGTVVASGLARAVVYATGQRSELGAIQRSLSRAQKQTALLEQQLDRLGRKLAIFSTASAVAVAVLGILHRQPALVILRGAVALGVAAIPEGFPSVGTTALALTSRQLREHGSIIRRLAAAETLGAVSIVCADKTGTLTENRMQIAELYTPELGGVRVEWTQQTEPSGSDATVRLVDEQGHEVAMERVRDLARIAALNADVFVSDTGDVSGASGTEGALVRFALAVGYPAERRRRSARRIGEKRRTRGSPMMVTTHLHPELGRIELAKGAPETVLAHCAGLEPPDREAIAAWNETMASRGLRVLALAWRRADEDGLRFAGLVGLRDPPRQHACDAIDSLARAGIQTLMLTGDQHRTAIAIGSALGIPAHAVFSRVTPEAKLAIVEDLQRSGKVVAMTGDGVNDGPALKAANVGVAMGKRGTDLARAVADVVLAQDDLPSLVYAIAQGRTLYDNVRRAIEYLVSTNASEVTVMVLGALAGVSPLAPLHLLWINLLTDIAPALALAVEPAGADVMERPPRDPREPLFGPTDHRRIAGRSGQMAGASLAAYALGAIRAPGRAAYASTMAFVSLVTSQLLHTERSRRDTGVANPLLRNVLGGTFLLQSVALLHPGLRGVLCLERLGGVDLLLSLVSGAWAGGALAPNALWPQPSDAIVRSRRGAPENFVPNAREAPNGLGYVL